MPWTEQHKVYFCQKILLIKPYQFKSGSKESGASWKMVSKNINRNRNRNNAMKLIHLGLFLKRKKLIYYCKILIKKLKFFFSNISQKATKNKYN